MGMMMPETCRVNLKVNKNLYLCHPLVLSSPTLMMHGHVNPKIGFRTEEELSDAVNETVNDSDSDTEGCYTRYHTLKHY